MNKYIYVGPVMRFNTCIAGRWVGETVAESEQKAWNNLKYQFKKKNNLQQSASVTLPGKLNIAN